MNTTSLPLLHARAAQLSWNVWPTATQTMLLSAALAEDAIEALEAWARWRDAVDFENLDYGSHRLLPLLHRNLVRHGAEPHPTSSPRRPRPSPGWRGPCARNWASA